MSAGSLTPQEAADRAVADWQCDPVDGRFSSIGVRAIELFESSRKRVHLTPEQLKAFEERIELCHVRTGDLAQIIAERIDGNKAVFMKTAYLDDGTPTAWCFCPNSLRQLAAVCEALATNLERFPL